MVTNRVYVLFTLVVVYTLNFIGEQIVGILVGTSFYIIAAMFLFMAARWLERYWEG